jgi:hypothetical protein
MSKNLFLNFFIYYGFFVGLSSVQGQEAPIIQSRRSDLHPHDVYIARDRLDELRLKIKRASNARTALWEIERFSQITTDLEVRKLELDINLTHNAEAIVKKANSADEVFGLLDRSGSSTMVNILDPEREKEIQAIYATLFRRKLEEKYSQDPRWKKLDIALQQHWKNTSPKLKLKLMGDIQKLLEGSYGDWRNFHSKVVGSPPNIEAKDHWMLKAVDAAAFRGLLKDIDRDDLKLDGPTNVIDLVKLADSLREITEVSHGMMPEVYDHTLFYLATTPEEFLELARGQFVDHRHKAESLSEAAGSFAQTNPNYSQIIEYWTEVTKSILTVPDWNRTPPMQLLAKFYSEVVKERLRKNIHARNFLAGLFPQLGIPADERITFSFIPLYRGSAAPLDIYLLIDELSKPFTTKEELMKRFDLLKSLTEAAAVSENLESPGIYYALMEWLKWNQKKIFDLQLSDEDLGAFINYFDDNERSPHQSREASEVWGSLRVKLIRAHVESALKVHPMMTRAEADKRLRGVHRNSDFPWNITYSKLITYGEMIKTRFDSNIISKPLQKLLKPFWLSSTFAYSSWRLSNKPILFIPTKKDNLSLQNLASLTVLEILSRPAKNFDERVQHYKDVADFMSSEEGKLLNQGLVLRLVTAHMQETLPATLTSEQAAGLLNSLGSLSLGLRNLQKIPSEGMSPKTPITQIDFADVEKLYGKIYSLGLKSILPETKKFRNFTASVEHFDEFKEITSEIILSRSKESGIPVSFELTEMGVIKTLDILRHNIEILRMTHPERAEALKGIVAGESPFFLTRVPRELTIEQLKNLQELIEVNSSAESFSSAAGVIETMKRSKELLLRFDSWSPFSSGLYFAYLNEVRKLPYTTAEAAEILRKYTPDILPAESQRLRLNTFLKEAFERASTWEEFEQLLINFPQRYETETDPLIYSQALKIVQSQINRMIDAKDQTAEGLIRLIFRLASLENNSSLLDHGYEVMPAVFGNMPATWSVRERKLAALSRFIRRPAINRTVQALSEKIYARVLERGAVVNPDVLVEIAKNPSQTKPVIKSEASTFVPDPRVSFRVRSKRTPGYFARGICNVLLEGLRPAQTSHR